MAVELSAEVLYEIFQYIRSPKTLVACSLVNHKWWEILQDAYLWEKIVSRNYERAANAWKYLSKQQTAKLDLPQSNYYKDLFIDLHKIESNRDMWCSLRRKTLDSVSGTPAASVSIVCLGDTGVGKTSLIWSCALQQVDINHTKTTVSQYTSTMAFYRSGKTAIFSTIDIPACEAKNYFQDQSFFCTQGCLLCFKLNEITTFNNVIENWLPLVRHAWGDITVLLVGLCADKVDIHCVERIQETCKTRNCFVCFTTLFDTEPHSLITPWKDVYNKLGQLMFP